MTISATDTIREVSEKYTHIMALSPDKVTAAVEAWPLPEYIPMVCRPWRRLWRRTVKNIFARNVSQLTVADLNRIEQLEKKAKTAPAEYMTGLLSVLLEIPECDVHNLAYLPAMAYLRQASKDLAKIPELWRSLSNLPRTADEQQAAVERPNRGWGGVLMEYSQGMNGAVLFTEAENTLWPVVFTYFQEQYFRAKERKNHEAIMQAKAKSKSYRRR